MDVATIDRNELKALRENVSRIVNSLELCWGCERICQCGQWVVKQEVVLWLCNECLTSVSRRLEDNSGDAFCIQPVSPEGSQQGHLQGP